MVSQPAFLDLAPEREPMPAEDDSEGEPNE